MLNRPISTPVPTKPLIALTLEPPRTWAWTRLIGERMTLRPGGGPCEAPTTRRMFVPIGLRNTRNTPQNWCGPWMYRTRPALLFAYMVPDGCACGGSVLNMFTCMLGCMTTQPGEFQHQVKSPLPLPGLRNASMSGRKKSALDLSPKLVPVISGINVEPWKKAACCWKVTEGATPPVITVPTPFTMIGPFGNPRPFSLVCAPIEVAPANCTGKKIGPFRIRYSPLSLSLLALA